MVTVGQLGGCARLRVPGNLQDPLHVHTVLVEKAVMARGAGIPLLNLHAIGAQVLSCAFMSIPDHLKCFPPFMFLKKGGAQMLFPSVVFSVRK